MDTSVGCSCCAKCNHRRSGQGLPVSEASLPTSIMRNPRRWDIPVSLSYSKGDCISMEFPVEAFRQQGERLDSSQCQWRHQEENHVTISGSSTV